MIEKMVQKDKEDLRPRPSIKQYEAQAQMPFEIRPIEVKGEGATAADYI